MDNNTGKLPTISNFCPLLSHGDYRTRCGKSKCALYIKDKRRCSIALLGEAFSGDAILVDGVELTTAGETRDDFNV